MKKRRTWCGGFCRQLQLRTHDADSEVIRSRPRRRGLVELRAREKLSTNKASPRLRNLGSAECGE